MPDQRIRDLYQVFYYQNDSRKSAFNRRVMIPVRSIDGSLAGYLGRSIDNQPDVAKYLFPRGLEKSKFLFGAHELTRPDGLGNGHLPLKVVYLVESWLSVLHFASLGFPAVSPFGWSVAEEQIRLLQGLAKGVIYIPDRNKRQSAHAVAALLAERLWTRFPPLPDNCQDPEFLTKEQIQSL